MFLKKSLISGILDQHLVGAHLPHQRLGVLRLLLARQDGVGRGAHVGQGQALALGDAGQAGAGCEQRQ
jgi:hypothetical protein